MATFDTQTEEFINSYVKALHQNSAAVFLGAGMSKESGYVDWAKLMEPVAKHLDLDIANETDYALLAQYCENEDRHKGGLNKLLFDKMNLSDCTFSTRHKILSRMPITTYWTTNYDTLMEDALKAEGKKVDVKTCINDFITSAKKHDVSVYKMHGEASKIHQVIITRRDYEEYNQDHWIFSDQFKCHYASKTFLFIGFSFSDPNINFLLGQLKNMYGKNMPSHYYITKKEENNYLHKRQKHQVALLRTYGIDTVLIEDYSMVQIILQEIEFRYQQKFILIAGGADGYGSWDTERAELFLYHLGYQLRKNDYQLISQMGNNVGKLVMQGANKWEQGNRKSYKAWSQKILPPPLDVDLNFHATSYSGIGSCIYLFGNKSEKGELICSPNWEQELHAFQRSYLKIVPVASTGFVAKLMWEKISNNFLAYYTEKEKGNFDNLGIPYENKDLPENSPMDYLNTPELLPDYGLIMNIIRTLNVNP